jgi:hypothetical protein
MLFILGDRPGEHATWKEPDQGHVKDGGGEAATPSDELHADLPGARASSHAALTIRQRAGTGLPQVLVRNSVEMRSSARVVAALVYWRM